MADQPERERLVDIEPVPVHVMLSKERRHVAERKAIVRRVCSEFEEMPGMCLTLPQAVRLFGISADVCERVLLELVADGWLRAAPNGHYTRRIAAA